MTATKLALPRAFKRALLISAFLHVGLIILIAASPSFSKSPQKGLVQYVNFMGGGGSGGGPGGGPGGATVVAKTEPLPPPKKQTLRDLTVPAKIQPEAKSALRHPVDKPKTDKKAADKKTAITKPEPSTPTRVGTDNAAAASGQPGGSGSGFGLRIGTGGGGGGTGGGTGSGAGDPFGVAGFPFQFYLQMISDKITANWFQSLVDPGVGGLLQTQVYFRIYKNGQISDIRIDVSSGIETFDLSARRAIQTSAPFAALPNEYDGQYLGITLVFEHAK
ncbi:MAG: TonB C-terminal domain-containing protein [Acidobacteria bacterium]|nr:TonB C-terminal domain-containing protein [Acidobacteriota bacterium]MBE3129708.1 TonB C-terminal domain-containing protein [Acidobacteriota bacterium]